MRLEGLRVERKDGLARRTIGLAWIGGGTEVSVEVPAEYAPADSDCSPFVPAALLVAMRRAEPLQIDGVVSRRLLESLTLAQEMLSSWNPTMRRIPVRAAAVDEAPPAPVAKRACFFSRGIDSTYSVALDRAPGDELSSLIHWRDFEFRYSEPTRDREVELARETARLLNLPMLVVSSDVPKPLVGIVDFNDATSAMLASVALSLPGLAGRILMASATGYGDLIPTGAHPLLDPLWSTERVEVEHDVCPLREDKVGWLVRNRPDLVPLIHVCMEQDSTENCGRCGKCVWAMMLFHLAGGLDRAAFPSRLDPKLLKKQYRGMPHQLAGSERVYRQLGDSRQDRALKRALLHGMRASTRRPMAKGGLGIISVYSRRMHQLLHGHLSDVPIKATGTAGADVGPLDPSWPPPRDVRGELLGLVRGVDHDARRHRYAAGELPPGQRSGELGALLRDQPDDGVPLMLDADGRPVLGEATNGGSAVSAARWISGPLVWRTGAAPIARVRSAARRATDTARARRVNGAQAAASPAGWLHRTGGGGRPALLAARHPVLDDVLLTTDPGEASALGYGEPETLGYLEPVAPVTGVVGPAAATIPWARRWGVRMPASTRVIWVLGMHRSGTSLVAGALRLLGAELGPSDTLLPPDPNDNPRGYWEQRAVIDLNNELLIRLGGSSWAPPGLEAGWEERPELDDLRERASAILGAFDPSAVWAIKDPRLSMTLPFWLPLVGESAAVVCLRSPKDVAASLDARDPGGPVSRRAWTGLWLEYTRAALDNAAGLRAEQLFYDDWFGDRDRQLRALGGLLGDLGSHPAGSALAGVDGFVAGELRHHASSLDEAATDPDSAPAARELYARLRADATARPRLRLSLPRRRRAAAPRPGR